MWVFCCQSSCRCPSAVHNDLHMHTKLAKNNKGTAQLQHQPKTNKKKTRAAIQMCNTLSPHQRPMTARWPEAAADTRRHAGPPSAAEARAQTFLWRFYCNEHKCFTTSESPPTCQLCEPRYYCLSLIAQTICAARVMALRFIFMPQ